MSEMKWEYLSRLLNFAELNQTDENSSRVNREHLQHRRSPMFGGMGRADTFTKQEGLTPVFASGTANVYCPAVPAAPVMLFPAIVKVALFTPAPPLVSAMVATTFAVGAPGPMNPVRPSLTITTVGAVKSSVITTPPLSVVDGAPSLFHDSIATIVASPSAGEPDSVTVAA